MSTADGRIIAEVLAVRENVGDIILLTHDSVPIITARRNELRAVLIPDSWRLAAETDPKDKEIARLTEELRTWQERAPRIEIDVCSEGTSVNRIEGTVRRYTPMSQGFLDRAIEAARRRHTKDPSALAGSLRDLRAEVLDDYRRDYAQWLEKLRDQLERYHRFLNFRDGLLRLRLAIVNAGSASAEGFVIEVFAEGDARLAEPRTAKDLIPESGYSLPGPPKIRGVGELFAGTGDMARFLHHHSPVSDRHLRSIAGPPSREFHWHYDGPEVSSERLEGTCGDFRHGIHREEAALAVWVPGNTVGAPAGCIRIRFSAKNLTAPAELVWPVRLTFECVNTEIAAIALLREQLDIEL